MRRGRRRQARLAVHWAHHQANEYADGEVFVEDLRGFRHRSPGRAGRGAGPPADQIGVRPVASTVDDLASAWRSALSTRRLLIVLDNAATTDQVRPMLPANPSCCAVVTSRNALAGLVARDDAARLHLDLLPADDSARLLQSVIGAPARRDLDGVRRLAGACGHLPLALRIAAELATARPDVGLSELAERLGRDPLRELDTPDDPHNALRSVLTSSYNALPSSAAQALRLLGVHPTATVDRTTAARSVGGLSRRRPQLSWICWSAPT